VSNAGDKAVDAAMEAAAGGHAVFVWTGDAGDGGEVIEAVETAGWRLEHFSASLSPSFAKTTLATCVFRRR
jgi:hypothetical protein